MTCLGGHVNPQTFEKLSCKVQTPLKYCENNFEIFCILSKVMTKTLVLSVANYQAAICKLYVKHVLLRTHQRNILVYEGSDSGKRNLVETELFVMNLELKAVLGQGFSF